MSTRSRIGILEDDKVTSIYCHFDGYIENNGVILFLYYNDIKKIKELLSHGDMSSLGETSDKGSTEYYHRDRTENKNDVLPIYGEDLFAFRKRIRDEVQYCYLYNPANKNWEVYNGEHPFGIQLEEEIVFKLKNNVPPKNEYMKRALAYFNYKFMEDSVPCKTNLNQSASLKI